MVYTPPVFLSYLNPCRHASHLVFFRVGASVRHPYWHATHLTPSFLLPLWAPTTLGPQAHGIRPYTAYGPCRGHSSQSPGPGAGPHGHAAPSTRPRLGRLSSGLDHLVTSPCFWPAHPWPGSDSDKTRSRPRSQDWPCATFLTRMHPTYTAPSLARRSTRLRPHEAHSPLTSGPALVGTRHL